MKKFKVIIFGGRDFDDYQILELNCNHLLKNKFPDIEIVSGAARGVDKLGERYAENYLLDVNLFPADWDNLDVEPCVIKKGKYGLYNALAGHNRNEEMASYADAAIGFDTG